jgi:hypothetical protein
LSSQTPVEVDVYLFELYTLIMPIWLPPRLIGTVGFPQAIVFQMFNSV